MSYSIETIAVFDRQAKKLIKKFRSLKSEIIELAESLKEEPTQGVQIKENCYKIRLAIKSKGKGKSGGARVITYVYIESEIVYLISIFDKSDKENISDKELEELLKEIQP